MADIASGDVTYTILNQRMGADSRKMNRVRLAFGDGALTYPAGGIPILKGKLGCPTIVESMVIVDQGTSGYSFQYDQSESKLVVIQGGSHTHALHFNNADVTDGAGSRINAGTNLLGANTGSDIAVAGVQDTSGAGGIVAAVAGAGGQVSAVAIAAQTIEVEVIGW